MDFNIVSGLDPNKWYLSGVFMTKECASTAGDKFDFNVLEAAKQDYVKGRMANKQSYGTVDHTKELAIYDANGNQTGSISSPEVIGSLKDICHMVVDLHWEGDYLIGTTQMLDCDVSDDLIRKMLSGCRINISVNGQGRRVPRGNQTYVQDFKIFSFDLVSDPADRNAVVYLHKGGNDCRILNGNKRYLENINNKYKENVVMSTIRMSTSELDAAPVQQCGVIPQSVVIGGGQNDAMSALEAIKGIVCSVLKNDMPGLEEVKTNAMVTMSNREVLAEVLKLSNQIKSIRQNSVDVEIVAGLLEDSAAMIRDAASDEVPTDEVMDLAEDATDEIGDEVIEDEFDFDELIEEDDNIQLSNKKKLKKGYAKLCATVRQSMKKITKEAKDAKTIEEVRQSAAMIQDNLLKIAQSKIERQNLIIRQAKSKLIKISSDQNKVDIKTVGTIKQSAAKPVEVDLNDFTITEIRQAAKEYQGKLNILCELIGKQPVKQAAKVQTTKKYNEADTLANLKQCGKKLKEKAEEVKQSAKVEEVKDAKIEPIKQSTASVKVDESKVEPIKQAAAINTEADFIAKLNLAIRNRK